MMDMDITADVVRCASALTLQELEGPEKEKREKTVAEESMQLQTPTRTPDAIHQVYGWPSAVGFSLSLSLSLCIVVQSQVRSAGKMARDAGSPMAVAKKKSKRLSAMDDVVVVDTTVRSVVEVRSSRA